jgi:transcriptional regulator with XRE-family HTH domain
MDAKKTGKYISDNRKRQGLSQKELADKLNITDKAISKWERGLSFPDISMLIPLSEILEITLYDLLTGGNEDE